MCDILCTADDISSTLSPRTTVFMMTHPLQAWHHTPWIRHCTHCIFSSQPLHWYHNHFWMTSHLLCEIICPIYNITSNLYVITLLYLWHHNLYIWNHIQYVRQHTHYTWDIKATICVLTPTVLMISHQLYFWDHIHYNSRHHIHCIWHDSHWICVITTTRLMISQPFYVWHHTHYMYNILYTT